MSTRMEERLAERRRAEAVRRSRRSGRVWLAVAAALAALWAAFGSPLFALTADRIDIAVEARVAGDGGEGVVARTDVDAALEPFVGERLTALDTGDVEQALTALPGARGAAVDRDWPRGLKVTVYEKVAVAAVPDASGAFVLVDADGGALRSVGAPPADLPVVVIPVGADNARTLDAVLGVVAQLPRELSEQVEGIRADSRDSVKFELRDGLTVVWGNASQTALKAEVLLLLLDSRAVEGAARIDVSAPSLPIVVDEPAE